MIKYDGILGMRVLSIEEAKDLGKILIAALDPKEGKVVGFVLEDENKEEKMLPIENIDAYGVDSVMVSSEDKLEDIGESPQRAAAIELGRRIIGLKIVTEEGKEGGEAQSFHFDEKTGKITHYEVSGGFLQNVLEGKGLLSQDGMVSIGPDGLVVKETAAELSEIMKVEPGLKHTALKVKATTEEVVEKAVRKVKKRFPGKKTDETGS